MPTMYITLWNQHDQEVIAPYTYGKNGKKSRKPKPVKLSTWQKIQDGYIDLWNMLRGK
jgi:hypothetical protein